MIDIYALHDPDTNEIRYIGKANDAAKRLKSHFRDARRRRTPVYDWINSLNVNGKIPVISIIEQVDDSLWKEREIFLIEHHRSIGTRLLNLALGGDEPFCPTEIRAANARKNARAVHDDPKRKLLWKRKQSLSISLKRGHIKPELRAKMKAIAQRRPDLFACWLDN